MTTTAKRPLRRFRRASACASPCVSVRKGLDPMFYADIESFRAAVADGSVDVSKGCQSMEEYFRSVSHG